MKCALAQKGCGGCEHIDKMYGDTLREKRNALHALFPQCEEVRGMEDPRHYRNKVLRTFANGRDALYSGIYRVGTHQVISARTCLLENERAGQIAFIATEILADMKLPAYREDFRKGLLRHLQVRRAHRSGQALVTVVTSGADFTQGKEFAEKLMKKCPDVRGVVQSINDRNTSAVMGFRSRILDGRDEMWDEMCGLHVCLTSRTFYQVNTAQAEKLYACAIDYAALTPADTVLDAYCGVGLIGMLAAQKAGKVTGVEIVSPSIDCARKAARVNKITNIDFVCADAGKALREGAYKPSVVFVDPPRAGCDRVFIDALLTAAPERIVYVSCNPETLRRDANLLGSRYTLEKVQGFDLFPYTAHTEAVALLTRKDRV